MRGQKPAPPPPIGLFHRQSRGGEGCSCWRKDGGRQTNRYVFGETKCSWEGRDLGGGTGVNPLANSITKRKGKSVGQGRVIGPPRVLLERVLFLLQTQLYCRFGHHGFPGGRVGEWTGGCTRWSGGSCSSTPGWGGVPAKSPKAKQEPFWHRVPSGP